MLKKINLQMFAEEPATEPTEPVITEPATEPTKTYTQEEVDRIVKGEVDRVVKGKKAEWEKKAADEYKKTSEAERLSRMTEAERTAERIKQLEDKLAEADRRDARAAMAKEARAILQDANINVGDELLSNLIADDADTTKANCNSFITLFKNEVEKAVKEAYKGETPRKGAAPTLTKEQILKVENRAERQRLMAENAHLF